MIEREDGTMKWGDLTPKQRKHLIMAAAQSINPKKDTCDETVLASLKELGLLRRMVNQKGRVVWRCTQEGRDLVAQLGMRPTFLHRQSQFGYTHNPAMRMRGEAEVMGEAA